MKIYNVYLEDEISDALKVLSRQELRDPRAQAAFIIGKELERLGLISKDGKRPPTPAEPNTEAIFAARKVCA